MKKLLFIFFNFIFLTLFADFTHPEINSGDVTFSKNQNTFEIKTFENSTYLKWDNFNILKDETYRFIQPNETSAVLNRVINGTTNISGYLQSNGKVFLLNPNGIVISKDAKIDVNSFIASTLDLLDVDAYFKNEEMNFLDNKSLGSIINLGKIKAFGDIYLISKNIENAGKLISQNGAINIAASDKILISPNEDQKINILSDATNIGIIENSGNIQASQIDIKAKNNPYALAIKHTGIINAKSIEKKDANIYLVAENSKVSIEDNAKILANENVATNVQILGKKVYVKDRSLIDISSENSEKNLYIGGGYQGKSPNLLNSDKTFVGKETKIIADGINKADGGRVILWSDGKTQFHGAISTKGGDILGDGGFIEVSGIKNLIYRGKIDTKALNGKTGTLLLDPSDITISAAATSGGSFDGGSPTDTFTPTLATANILNTELYSALDAANVVINTTSSFGSSGDISFIAAFTYVSAGASGGGITLNADNDIIVATGIATSFSFNLASQADITFNAANDINIDGNLTITNPRNITMTAGNDFDIRTSRTFDMNFATLATLTAGNDFTVANSGTVTGQIDFSTTSSLAISAGNDVSILGRVENTSNGDVSVTATRDILVGPSTNSVAAQSRSRVGTANGDVTINAGRNLTVMAGAGANTSFAQIGYNAAAVDSDIYLTIGNDLTVESSSTRDDAFAMIGHGGSFSNLAGIRKGNIIINSIGNDATIDAKGATTFTECFAQIGHAHVDDADIVTLTGDIRGPTPGSYGVIGGDLKIEGGVEIQAYALVGHGGSNITGNITTEGNILIRANSIEIEGGSDQDTSAGIGFRTRFSGGTPTAFITDASVKVFSDTTLILKGGDFTGASGAAFIGGFVNTTANTRFGVIDMDLIDVYAGTYIVCLGGLTAANENIVLIGAKVFNDNDQTAIVGTSKSNLNIFAGQDFSNISRNGEKIFIQNGNTTTAGRTFNITTGKDLFIQVEETGIFFEAIDTASYNIGRDLNMFSDEEETYINAQNQLNINIGRDLQLIGHCATGVPASRDATIKNQTGDLGIFINRNATLGSFGKIRNDGSGETVVVVDNAFPTQWEMGPGELNMNIHSQIGRSGGGLVRIFTASRSQNFIATYAGTFSNAKINNTVFSAGPLFVDSATEKWATYYPSNFGGAPFTIFYKDFAMPTVLSIIQQDPRIFYPNYELFYKPFYRYYLLSEPRFHNPWPQVNQEAKQYNEKHLFL